MNCKFNNQKLKIKNLKSISGFTLLELIVVIVIIGVLAGVSAPRIFNSLNAGKLRGESNKILSTLRYAQGMAAIQRATYRLKFNLGESEFDDEKEFVTQSYQLFRDESKNDAFDLSDADFDGSTGYGQKSSGMPAKDDFDYKDDEKNDKYNKDDYYYDDENETANSNRNLAGPVNIFDEADHKFPSGVKITKIIDVFGDYEITKGNYEIAIESNGNAHESYIYLTSSGKNPSTYIIHIGMNGLSEAYLKDED